MLELFFRHLSCRAGILFACLVLGACSPEKNRYGERGNNPNGPPSPAAAGEVTSSSGPGSQIAAIAPLKIPARVASGAVTESRGTWNSAVQKVTYVGSADNTRQAMPFGTIHRRKRSAV